MLYDDASGDYPFGRTVFRFPGALSEELPRTTQRRRFLTSSPFLVCDVASLEFDRYVDVVPAFRPETFADAIMTRRYEDSSVGTAQLCTSSTLHTTETVCVRLAAHNFLGA